METRVKDIRVYSTPPRPLHAKEHCRPTLETGVSLGSALKKQTYSVLIGNNL